MNWYLTLMTQKYASFSGRARRTEYWMFFLVYFVIALVIGVVEGFPGIDMVKKRLSAMKPSRVALAPFMVVAGDHARNDMADEDDPESWISELREEGYSVEAVLKGLGDGEGLAELFVAHILEAAGDR